MVTYTLVLTLCYSIGGANSRVKSHQQSRTHTLDSCCLVWSMLLPFSAIPTTAFILSLSCGLKDPIVSDRSVSLQSTHSVHNECINGMTYHWRSIGKPEMFSHLVEKGRETEWHYGPVQCNLYPLSELDFWVSKDPKYVALGGVATTHQKVSTAIYLLVSTCWNSLGVELSWVVYFPRERCNTSSRMSTWSCSCIHVLWSSLRRSGTALLATRCVETSLHVSRLRAQLSCDIIQLW